MTESRNANVHSTQISLPSHYKGSDGVLLARLLVSLLSSIHLSVFDVSATASAVATSSARWASGWCLGLLRCRLGAVVAGLLPG